MASPASTFATLRALHLVISDALDDIQRVFAQNALPDSPSLCSSPLYSTSPDLSPTVSPFPATPPTSFPPTPLSATFPPLRPLPLSDDCIPCVDYPPPDLPHAPDSHSEQLALHPDAAAAASRIVAACGQISSIVHKPFLSICDAIMGYNLPACMRLVESLHIAEILREDEESRQQPLNSGSGSIAPLSVAKPDPNVGPDTSVASPLTRDVSNVRPPTAMAWNYGASTHKGSGMHIADITNVICSYAGDGYVDPSDLVHVLRLLSTHHIFRETSPDTFALTRVASLLDSGKSVEAIFSNPETKYDGTDGVPAFVALTTDEIFKSAAYLTEAFAGVQPQILASTPNATFHGTTTVPSTGCIMNVPAPCPSTTRSSSALTHIVYPEDENILVHPPPTNSLDRVTSLSLLPDGQSPPQSSGPEPQAPLLTCQSAIEVSSRAERKCQHPRGVTKPERFPAFNFAFYTNRPFFEWLENGGRDPLGGTGQGACISTLTGPGCTRGNIQPTMPGNELRSKPGKSYRLQRFSKAMTATTGWEAPKAILSGFSWRSLPKGSTIVDVGGGIGSTTMILARALNDARLHLVKRQESVRAEESGPSHPAGNLPSDPSLMTEDEPKLNNATEDSMNFRFVVQDRPVVTVLGIEAWRSRCPEMLDSGQVVFQDQDFFEPQAPLGSPHRSRYPAVYLLRVVLHDWPDECVRRILINLRVASNPDTRLLIAEHVLPLACVDEDVVDYRNDEPCDRSGVCEWTVTSVLAHIEGAERALVAPPLLSNLGKANASAYSMDLMMHMTLNGKERTLREFCALSLSAGWRITRMTRVEGSLFAYLVCEPISLPDDAQAIHNAVVLSSELSAVVSVPSYESMDYARTEASPTKKPPAATLLPPAVLVRPSSRCGTPTFGSRTVLPKEEELQSPRTRGTVVAKKWLKSKKLGVRGVIMQKAEKQRETQNSSKGTAPRDNDVVSAPPSHVRVWWKKSPKNSISNSSTVIHGLDEEVPVQQAAGRGPRGTPKLGDTPSTPSPRIPAAHQKWPSIDSVALPMLDVSPSAPHARRPSMASITRKLSFASFRRPSIVDNIEPLPTPPLSTSLTELVPPPMLDRGVGRLKHLPSLPMLGRSGAAAGTARQSAIPRHPSLHFAEQVLFPQPVPRSAFHVADSPKPGILKSRSNPHTCKQSSPDTGISAAPTPTSIPQRQRRMTLSSSLPRAQTPMPGSVLNAAPDCEVRHIPNVPQMPRRLSIPMLRRKQSQPVLRGAENGS